MHSLPQLQQYSKLIESIIQSSKSAAADLKDLTVNDRPVYRRLRICCQLQDMTETVNIDRNILTALDQLGEHPMAGRAFQLAGQLLDKPALTARSRRIFDQLIASQQPSGEFLPPDLNTNLESRWYEELILLHAIAGYSASVPDRAIARAVQQSAEFHVNETQPDHATTEPWGLLAFIQFAPPMADQLLHAMTMQNPQGLTGIPLLLLCDVMYGLKQLTREADR